MSNTDIPLVIKRCLAHGIVIIPIFLTSVIKKYEVYRMPDKELSSLNKDDLERYVKGLELSGRESAGDWSRGHELLKSLGFSESVRIEGHRSFTSLVWGGLDK